MRYERPSLARSAALLMLILVVLCSVPAWAQSRYYVLHNFGISNGDGWQPFSGLVRDANGNLYGTTVEGGYTGGACGRPGCGIVFELSPNPDGAWSEAILHSFNYGDGAEPYASVVFDGRGNLYGITTRDGPLNYGTIFELTPASNGSWALSTLHAFTGGWDGGFDPNYPSGGLAFGDGGHLYGTTSYGGANNKGIVLNLGRVSALSWYELVAHAFAGGNDGSVPQSAPTVGVDGNVYGTTFLGGSNGAGTVYRLTPNQQSFGWTETVLYSFQGTPYGSGADGANPAAGMIFDAAGNLYGATIWAAGWRRHGISSCVFDQTVAGPSAVLYTFQGYPSAPTPSLTASWSSTRQVIFTAQRR